MRRGILRGLSVLAITLGFALAGTSANATQAVQAGTWTIWSQDYSNWCWAAGAFTIVYHEKGASYNECQLVRWGLGRSDCPNNTGTLAQMISAMRQDGLSHPGQSWTGYPYPAEMRSVFGAAHGLLQRIQWSGTTLGHIAPLIGTRIYNGRDQVEIVNIGVDTVSYSWIYFDDFVAGKAGFGTSFYTPTHYVNDMRA